MPQPKTFLVGRQAEIEQFAFLLHNQTKHWMLNIFGPGGIGKTVVGQKMQVYADQNGIPFALVDGIRPDLTPDRILYFIKEGFTNFEPLESAFDEFEREYEEYLVIQDVLQRGGGIQSIFDTVGSVKDPGGLAAIVGSLGKGITERVQRNLNNRFALERYLRGVEKGLTTRLAADVNIALEKSQMPMALVLDTYEEMEGLDDWICRSLITALPKGVKIVFLGRNALPKINFDWKEFGDDLYTMDLPELGEADAKAYLTHYGLHSSNALDQIYRFTGGYPLLLVLVRHLAQEAGGWEKIGTLDSNVDRDAIATELLKRILREERVEEVRSFLEKGVVARWFDPETISVLVDISIDDARKIYDKLSRHSFVERHPYGLKFHDKIRELLLERLKFTSESEYKRLTKCLINYYAEKAGITPPEEGKESSTEEQPSPKFVINIQHSTGIVIGDEAQLKQNLTNQHSEENGSAK